MGVLRLALIGLVVFFAVGAEARGDQDAVEQLIANWYAELRKREDPRLYSMLAPAGMILPQHCPDRCGPQPRMLIIKKGERFSHFLAVRAEKFSYEIERSQVDASLARIDVWERGWTYAWAAKQTYQSAASAMFILEKRAEGWKVLVYKSEARAIHPKHKDDPMPDLSPKDR